MDINRRKQKKEKILQGGRDRTLAVKSRENDQKSVFCNQIKITKKIVFIFLLFMPNMGETNFQPWEFLRSGSKAIDVKEEREEERKRESW